MVKIKICGITNLKEAEIINQTKPDYFGLVFASGSHLVDIDTARQIRQEVNKNIPAVGVFVDAPFELIKQLADEKIIQIAQLHGSEKSEDIKRIRTELNIPVIDVINEDKLHRNSDADFLMVDARTSTVTRDQLSNDDSNLFVAGGINPENAQQTIDATKPFAIDVSRGVEVDGKKDIELVKAIVSIAHNN
ncbi:phosphoribosylanthranilate isomerase [Apilactobacillus nanyangensis]|uniref:N-(5'-phosphoribosyl)anthranilate isomerase n=1 Tax=Apilactobacillus nanyangensis TaxID=2799579 RepID=A0ABT0I083_9LACO|nr:phosphoribosylanthranilate isomerase [Apilactobacillus nanyangensis]MCK8611979.1 phosphoribosylanthranilate isomerase [Apilactobacillus nanyangensis]